MDICLISIGVIHSPFNDPAQASIQASRSIAKGNVEVFPQYVEGLSDLNEFLHIFFAVLDIKPFVPDFDIRENAQIGWYGHRTQR